MAKSSRLEHHAQDRSARTASQKLPKAWAVLNQQIRQCQACPRLISHCQQIATVKRKAYVEHSYWGGPVENFVGTAPIESSTIDDSSSQLVTNMAGKISRKTKPENRQQRDLLIVGLAPGAHGANRTGRMFTGDRSGDWLYRALNRGGFASQANSVDRSDGMILHDCVITAVCHCAPPDNKPTTEEIQACQNFLETTVGLGQPKVILALGKIAWDATARLMRQQPQLFDYASSNTPTKTKSPAPAILDKSNNRKVAFGHGQTWKFADHLALVGSYHPSQQNTFTGRLTEEMLDQVIQLVHDLLD